jgi:hypothetical protein
MFQAKQIADLVTVGRGFLAFFLAWMGFAWGKPGLAAASIIMILCWTGDYVDGRIARMDRQPRHTWIGDHDVQVDVFVSLGLGVFLLGAGYISRWLALLYLVGWILVLWKFGPDRNLLMLFQAPVYGYFIWVANQEASQVGRWIIFWIILVLVLNWRKFATEVVPGFIHGILGLWSGNGTSNDH